MTVTGISLLVGAAKGAFTVSGGSDRKGGPSRVRFVTAGRSIISLATP